MRSIRFALAAIAVTASLSVTGLASAGMTTASGRSHAHADSHTTLTGDIAAARLATARYVTNLAAARADGYQIITRMIPGHGLPLPQPEREGV